VDAFELTDAAGKVWRLGKATGESRKAMIAAVAQLSWASVAEMQTLCPEAFDTISKAYARDIEANEHKPGGRLWKAHAEGAAGTALFVYALLKPQHPDAKLSDAREILAHDPAGVSAAVAVLVPGFFGLLAGHPETPPEHRQAFRAAGERAAQVIADASSSTTGSA
jgi:hypothetical protein